MKGPELEGRESCGAESKAGVNKGPVPGKLGAPGEGDADWDGRGLGFGGSARLMW